MQLVQERNTILQLYNFTLLQLSLSCLMSSCINADSRSERECLPMETKESEVWTYHCINNKCKRLMVNEYIKIDEQICEIPKRNLTSYKTCKLFCGDSTLWPLPTGDIVIEGPAVPISHRNTEVIVKFDTSQDVEPKSKELFNNLSKYFKKKIFKKFPENAVERRFISNKLVITGVISEPNHISLNLKTDESYTIKVEHDRTNEVKALITSDNFYGLRHGFQTLSQLIVYDDYEKLLLMPWKIFITDSPAYPIRGLTLDTSRNFIKVSSIKRTIDAMAENKLNTFHWHITDTHSFPLILPNNPNFAKFGAYGADKVYKPEEVRELVEYARIRGVKIVPEFDAPAHVGYGWQWIPSQLVVCLDEQPWSSYCVEAPCGQLDPTQEILYQKLYSIYSDMFEIFDVDSLFHMGGDEVHFQCWNKTESIVDWMKDRGWKTDDEGFLQLWNYFQQRALENVMSVSAKAGKANSPDIILWTSHLTTGDALDKYVDQNKYIIQIWTKGLDPNVGELLNKGYRVIFSNYDALYFDCGFGSWVGEGNNWCSPYIPWQKIYDNNPLTLAKTLTGGNSTEKDFKKQILGQIATLWTEQVEDLSMDSRYWPRASAMAERTWSDPSTGWKEAEYRYLYQRNRLVDELGIAADGQEPLFCSLNEGSCPMDQS